MKASCLHRLRRFDRARAQKSAGRVGGVDESGRGPLAGPVVAAAVILHSELSLEGLNDSKQLTSENRKTLFWRIVRQALVGIGVVGERIIDEINIHQASRLAMKQAVLSLSHTPSFLLIDGPITLDLPVPQEPVIDGDAKSASIAAASVVAKVYRDALMEDYDRIYPGYSFGMHKGYGTVQHLSLLEKMGPCPIHRRSFAPVNGSLSANPTGLSL